MPDLPTLALILTVLFLAGLVKGVIGFGLPTVALALLAATIGVTQAMAIMLVPALVTNLWQGFYGGHLRAIARRLWPFLLCGGVVTILAAQLLRAIEPVLLSMGLGLVLCVYALASLLSFHPPAPRHKEKGWSAGLGVVNGVFTGLTGTFVVPSVGYFQALALPRDMLIQTMGVWFSIATLSLAIGLSGQSLLSVDLGMASLLALPPALLGMYGGQKIRAKLPEHAFRRFFFIGLLAVGAFMLFRPLL